MFALALTSLARCLVCPSPLAFFKAIGAGELARGWVVLRQVRELGLRFRRLWGRNIGLLALEATRPFLGISVGLPAGAGCDPLAMGLRVGSESFLDRVFNEFRELGKSHLGGGCGGREVAYPVHEAGAPVNGAEDHIERFDFAAAM